MFLPLKPDMKFSYPSCLPPDTSTEAKDEADFFGGERSFQASSLIVEATTLSRASKGKKIKL